MPFTDEAINALNAQENAYPLAFFQKFAQDITVYEDDDIWVVDKPAGLLSVDGKSLKVSLLARLERANPAVKLIHRLDMDTSGLLIFAKNAAAQSHISKQFIDRLPQGFDATTLAISRELSVRSAWASGASPGQVHRWSAMTAAAAVRAACVSIGPATNWKTASFMARSWVTWAAVAPAARAMVADWS